jgi:hypothetical protein
MGARGLYEYLRVSVRSFAFENVYVAMVRWKGRFGTGSEDGYKSVRVRVLRELRKPEGRTTDANALGWAHLMCVDRLLPKEDLRVLLNAKTCCRLSSDVLKEQTRRFKSPQGWI